jgi:hypothetical protein
MMHYCLFGRRVQPLLCTSGPDLLSYLCCQVSDVIELSKKTLRKITQNLGWAFCYNLVGIPLAAGALLPKYGVALTPSISGALMGASSLAVMANSLMLQLEVRGLRNGLLTEAAPAVAKSAAQQQQQQQHQQQQHMLPLKQQEQQLQPPLVTAAAAAAAAGGTMDGNRRSNSMVSNWQV